MKNRSQLFRRANDAVLLVASYDMGQMTGQLLHPWLERPMRIESVPHLVLTLDEILLREEGMVSYHAFEHAGAADFPCIATLRIRILFREHSTWQGVVEWEEERKEAAFQSVFELIQILDEILSG